MDGLAVVQQNYAEEFTLFFDICPPPYASVCLDFLSDGMAHRPLNPFQFDSLAVRTLARVKEIGGELDWNISCWFEYVFSSHAYVSTANKNGCQLGCMH